jgi:hypothetical protein
MEIGFANSETKYILSRTSVAFLHLFAQFLHFDIILLAKYRMASGYVNFSCSIKENANQFQHHRQIFQIPSAGEADARKNT